MKRGEEGSNNEMVLDDGIEVNSGSGDEEMTDSQLVSSVLGAERESAIRRSRQKKEADARMGGTGPREVVEGVGRRDIAVVSDSVPDLEVVVVNRFEGPAREEGESVRVEFGEMLSSPWQLSGMEDGSRKDVEMSEPERQSQGSEKTVSSSAIDISPLTKVAGLRS